MCMEGAQVWARTRRTHIYYYVPGFITGTNISLKPHKKTRKTGLTSLFTYKVTD